MSEVDIQNTESDAGGAPPPEVDNEPAEQHEGPGSGRSDIRRSLEKGFEDARREAEPETTKGRRQPKRGDRVGSRLADMPDSGSSQAAPAEAEAEGGEVIEATPPEGWSQEAKQEWEATPDNVRAAVLKREADVARGVQALRDRYSEIDNALSPHLQAIQAHGQTPAAAINQLFGWFNALAQNPDAAFPALAASFGHDLRRFVKTPQQQRPQQEQPQGQIQQNDGQQQQVPPIDPRYANWVNQNFQKSYQAYQALAQQLAAEQQMRTLENQRRTDQHLASWAKDKPFFEQARVRMAQLLNEGAIPLLPDGSPDLDRAYEEAIWSLKDVRVQIQQQQAAAARAAAKAKKDAELKAQRELADKARRAGTSVPISAPGVPPGPGKAKPSKGKSVRESLLDSIEAHRE